MVGHRRIDSGRRHRNTVTRQFGGVVSESVYRRWTLSGERGADRNMRLVAGNCDSRRLKGVISEPQASPPGHVNAAPRRGGLAKELWEMEHTFRCRVGSPMQYAHGDAARSRVPGPGTVGRGPVRCGLNGVGLTHWRILQLILIATWLDRDKQGLKIRPRRELPAPPGTKKT